MDVDMVDCGLHPRVWSFGTAAGSERQMVLLAYGAGEVEAGDRRFGIAGPAVAWIGGSRSGRLRMDAGTTGLRARIGDGILVEAIGESPEAVDLRYLVDRDFSLSLAGQARVAQSIQSWLEAVAEERRRADSGSSLIVSAFLRLILAQLLRISSGSETTLPGIGERPGLLHRFRQLVEMNFRSHWPIARYAEALGISTDRLHAICTSSVGKSPKALVSERLAQEAMLRLERSALTIQQLGHSLGFHDPAHFSSFFRRMTGQPPGRYRRLVLEARAGRARIEPPGFAEWP